MNKVILTGRIANDLELVVTTTGKYVTEFRIAVNRMDDKTDFISVVAWNKQAENLCNYQRKGSLIAVEGSVNVDEYRKKDGHKGYKVYVRANNIEYLQTKKDSPSLEQPAANADFEEVDINDDDLPF